MRRRSSLQLAGEEPRQLHQTDSSPLYLSNIKFLKQQRIYGHISLFASIQMDRVLWACGACQTVKLVLWLPVSQDRRHQSLVFSEWQTGCHKQGLIAVCCSQRRSFQSKGGMETKPRRYKQRVWDLCTVPRPKMAYCTHFRQKWFLYLLFLSIKTFP